MNFRLKNALIAACTFTLGSMPAKSLATENGAVSYPLGVNTINAGAMPGPGETWWQNYTLYYSANKFSGASGHNLVPGFDAGIFGNAARIFHGWDAQLGPFQLGSAIIIPVVNADIENTYGSDTNSGIGDITLQPLYLGWSNTDRSFYGYAGVDVFVPTGSKVSNNFFSINPLVVTSWRPTPKLEMSFLAGLEFHTENTNTDYLSGSLFYLDWGANYQIFDALPQLTVGLGGYFVKQFTDDKLEGEVFQNGFRQEGFAIGPQIAYGTQHGAIAVKYQREFATENRPSGDRFWLQFFVPLGGR